MTPSPEDIESIIDKIEETLKEMEEGKKTSIEALKEIVELVSPVRRELPEDTIKEIDNLEYSLAYNSLVDGEPPSKVLPLLDGDAREKLEKDLGKIGEELIEYYYAMGKTGEAVKLLDEYKTYMDKDEYRMLSLIGEPAVSGFITAVNNEDYGKAVEALRQINEKRLLTPFKELLGRIYDVDADKLIDSIIYNYAVDVLSTSKSPSDAMEKLSSLPNVSHVSEDLRRAGDAYKKAVNGDVVGFTESVSHIKDGDVARIALVSGLGVLFKEHPESILTADSNLLHRLESIASRYNVKLGISSLKDKMSDALGLLRDINEKLGRGEAGEALEKWENSPSDTRTLAALMAGMTAEDMEKSLRRYAHVEDAVKRFAKMAGMLESGRYIDAYNYWRSLDEKYRETISSLVGEDESMISQALGLMAGLEDVSSLENPTLDKVKEILSRYVGEELAGEIARKMMEDTDLYKAKTLADKGKYDEALKAILSSRESEDNKRMMVQYIIASIYEHEGAEAVSSFIERNKDKISKYVGDKLVETVELIGKAGSLADMIDEILGEVAGKEYAARIKAILGEYESLLRDARWREAEDLVKRNHRLLSEVEVKGRKLAEIMGDMYTIARAGHFLEDSIRKLEEYNRRIKENPREVAGKAEDIAEEAEAYLESMKNVGLDPATRDAYVESLKKLEAQAYSTASQAYLLMGDYEKADEAASKAYKLDPSLRSLYNTVHLFRLALEDKTAVQKNIECILENVLNIRRKGAVGGKGRIYPI